MKILAIETSADETAVALLECGDSFDDPSIKVIKQSLYSQIKDHVPYGGIFPMLAKRAHAKNLVPLLLETIAAIRETDAKPAELSEEQEVLLRDILSREGELIDLFFTHVIPLPVPAIDAIAVTHGPGLEPALWVGLSFAKALSHLWDLPLIPVNHMEGHICSVMVDATNSTRGVAYPAIALLASGGHTELVRVNAPLSYEALGQTRDDAVGEAFDKVARLLGLPYPGGPQIGALARQSRELGEQIPKHLELPRPMLHSGDFDFSYAGLKTAVLYKVRELGTLDETTKRLIARSFEEAAIDVLIAKARRALEQFPAQTLIIGGGVAASDYLRERAIALVQDVPDVELRISERMLSTDNAIMIGIAGYLRYANTPTAYATYRGEGLRAHGILRL